MGFGKEVDDAIDKAHERVMGLRHTIDGHTYKGIKSLDNIHHAFGHREFLVVAYFEGSPELWAITTDPYGIATLRNYYSDQWPGHIVPFDVFSPKYQGL